MLSFKQTLECFLPKHIFWDHPSWKKNTLLAIEKCHEIKVKGEQSEFK